jgi:hypothetical protein
VTHASREKRATRWDRTNALSSSPGQPTRIGFINPFGEFRRLTSGAVEKRGAVLQERDVPAQAFLDEIERRGIKIEYRVQ